MKKNLIIPVVLILLLVSSVFFATRVLFPKHSDLEQKLLLEANEINKTCPLIVDDATRLDNAVVYPNNVYQYNYTLVNLTRNDINPEVAIKSLEPKIIENVKKDVALKTLKEAFTTLNFSYRDRNGEFVFRIIITPDKYK